MPRIPPEAAFEGVIAELNEEYRRIETQRLLFERERRENTKLRKATGRVLRFFVRPKPLPDRIVYQKFHAGERVGYRVALDSPYSDLHQAVRAAAHSAAERSRSPENLPVRAGMDLEVEGEGPNKRHYLSVVFLPGSPRREERG